MEKELYQVIRDTSTDDLIWLKTEQQNNNYHYCFKSSSDKYFFNFLLGLDTNFNIVYHNYNSGIKEILSKDHPNHELALVVLSLIMIKQKKPL